MLFDAFISYARNDHAVADEYYSFLESLGMRVWYDRLATNKVSPYPEIEIALRDSSFVILLWSASAAGADFVQKEIELAADLGKRIIPIKLDGRGFTSGTRIIVTGTTPINGRRGLPTDEIRELASRILPSVKTASPVYACLNMKGGVGKTTLAANIAATLHRSFEKSVLLVDLDPQANLSNLLIDNQKYDENLSRDRSVISCFEHSIATGASGSPTQSLFSVNGAGSPPVATRLAFNLRNPINEKRFDLVLGQFDLFKYSLSENFRNLAQCRARFEMFIRSARQQYDAIILDAAPSNSFITECVITSATDIIAPTTPDKYALRGIQAISRLMAEGFRLDPPKPIHVLRNAVAATPDKAELAIIDAYSREILEARIPESGYFEIRNPDPNERVRDPLATLASYRGRTAVREQLEKACTELSQRSFRN